MDKIVKTRIGKPGVVFYFDITDDMWRVEEYDLLVIVRSYLYRWGSDVDLRRHELMIIVQDQRASYKWMSGVKISEKELKNTTVRLRGPIDSKSTVSYVRVRMYEKHKTVQCSAIGYKIDNGPSESLIYSTHHQLNLQLRHNSLYRLISSPISIIKREKNTPGNNPI